MANKERERMGRQREFLKSFIEIFDKEDIKSTLYLEISWPARQQLEEINKQLKELQ